MPDTLPAVAVISQRLLTFLDDRLRETSDLGDEAEGFLTRAAAATAGGKMLRARFCLRGWESVAALAGTRDAPPSVVATCAALEVFQAAALVHDDLIDNSDTRRGRPAAHRDFEAWHDRAAWVGDATAFGRAGALLLGDLLVAWSDDLLEEGLADAAAGAEVARAEYARMRRDVTVGQFLDIAEESAWRGGPADGHVERALRIASLKSARYSVVQPLRLGAALAGADADQLQALTRFGHPLGLAFQLRDDVLGVFGDTAETGKPAGDDLREGKRTVLVALTRAELPPTALRVFDELLGDPQLDDEQVASLRATISSVGALIEVERRIGDYAREADRALSGARLDNAAVGALRDLARAATVRTS